MNAKIHTLIWGAAALFALSALQFGLADQAEKTADQAEKSNGETVKFKPRAWRSGDTVESKLTVDGTLSVTMSVLGDLVQRFDQSNHEMSKKKTVVLAADEDGPTKISVHYVDVVESQEGMVEQETDPKAAHPLAGRTFVLEKNKKSVAVKEEDGTAVGDDIAALVREREVARDGSLRRGFDRLAALVSESPRKIGDRIHVDEDTALEIAGGTEDLKDGRMTLELREVRDVDGVACAVFASEISLAGKPSGEDYKTSVELTGEILLRVDGLRFVSAELSGKLSLDGVVSTEDTVVTVAGDGPMKIVVTAVHGHEKL